ncbi:hypothetical protein TrVGV298_007036 [Trichoderma virens]|nr:hypothetical protein TrVGV298_007036 [Trichoderma virens]
MVTISRKEPNPACQHCRAKKIRCEKSKPQCARCKRLRKDCNYATKSRIKYKSQSNGYKNSRTQLDPETIGPADEFKWQSLLSNNNDNAMVFNDGHGNNDLNLNTFGPAEEWNGSLNF